jgi:ABC-type nitrate/sulfonate/bicarbonate transport system substrate-binding protein
MTDAEHFSPGLILFGLTAGPKLKRLAVAGSALVFLAGSALAQVSPPPVPHPNPVQELRVIGFAGGFNLPIWAGQRQGYFADEGIRVDLTYTPNSVYQITNLLAGHYDVAMTAIDNVIAYQEGQNEAPIGPNPDLFAFFGSDNAFLSLVSQQPYQQIEDLKGKTLTVDAMTTGFAFVLREILALNGISEQQVKFERAGGVASRFRAMLENPKHAATMQMTPFELQGQARGLNTLVRAEEALGRPYQGMVGAARRSWAAENREVVAGLHPRLSALGRVPGRSSESAGCRSPACRECLSNDPGPRQACIRCADGARHRLLPRRGPE